MARYSIAYAHQAGAPDLAHPLGVVAQDDEGIHAVAVPQDLVALAKSLGHLSQTFVSWADSFRMLQTPRRVRSADGQRDELAEINDPRWLASLIEPGYVDTYTYGPITDEAGTAAEVAERKAKELAASLPATR